MAWDLRRINNIYEPDPRCDARWATSAIVKDPEYALGKVRGSLFQPGWWAKTGPSLDEPLPASELRRIEKIRRPLERKPRRSSRIQLSRTASCGFFGQTGERSAGWNSLERDDGTRGPRDWSPPEDGKCLSASDGFAAAPGGRKRLSASDGFAPRPQRSVPGSFTRALVRTATSDDPDLGGLKGQTWRAADRYASDPCFAGCTNLLSSSGTARHYARLAEDVDEVVRKIQLSPHRTSEFLDERGCEEVLVQMQEFAAAASRRRGQKLALAKQQHWYKGAVAGRLGRPPPYRR